MNPELIFIPSPGAGHLYSAVEMAKLLVRRDNRLSITVLIMNRDTETTPPAYSDDDRLRFIQLPGDEGDDKKLLFSFIDSQTPHVRKFVAKLAESSQLAGFVIDMFCTSMIDVANELGLPTYMYFTSSAAVLGFHFHVLTLADEQNIDIADVKESATELEVPSLEKPLYTKCIPSFFFNKDWNEQSRRFKETKGILVNTFSKLESYAIKSFNDPKIPTIYPVGPILHLDSASDNSSGADIIEWLDDQPRSSVVFLCFGSYGSFDVDQVKEIALALEASGHRFLWSLRRPPPKGELSRPSEYMDYTHVLPLGFLERTVNTGKVIGWAPQVSVLAHPAIGGFVTHCGWNSTLESLWFGVPTATWPLYAEQQFNAFTLVVELGLSVEIRIDYCKDFFSKTVDDVVTAEEIERGIKDLMENKYETRNKVKKVSEESRTTLVEGGTSYAEQGRFIQDVIDNVR